MGSAFRQIQARTAQTDALLPDAGPEAVSRGVPMTPGGGTMGGVTLPFVRATPPVRRDIQGLRALAILGVVLFHAFPLWLPGGMVGVDIFFVISGFLMTQMISSALERGTFSLPDFYTARLRRLLPALMVMLACVGGAGWMLLSPQDFAELGRTTASAALFLANFDFLDLTDYFDGAAQLKPLLHTWSLAVEAQFYLLLPLLLLAVRDWSGRARAWLLGGVALASLMLSVGLTHVLPRTAFYLAPTRAFEMLLGALVALSGRRFVLPGVWGTRAMDALSLVGLAMMGWSIAALGDDVPWPGFAALLPCGGCALVLWAGQNGGDGGRTSWAGWVLGRGVFQFFGNISYSLYLWHWPFLVFAHHILLRTASLPETGGLLLAAVMMATLSWYWVERRFVQSYLSAARPMRRFAVSTVSVAVGLGLGLLALGGVAERYSGQAQNYFSARGNNPQRAQCHGGKIDIPYAENCLYPRADLPPRVAVWADSHGAELVVGLGEAAAAQGVSVMQITTKACPPVVGWDSSSQPGCMAHNRTTLQALLADTRIETVVLAGYWPSYPQEALFVAGFDKSVAALRAAGKRVLVLGPVPTMPYPVPTAAGLLAARRQTMADFGLDRATHQEQAAAGLALAARAQRLGAVVVDPRRALCAGAWCRAADPTSGVLWYFDEHHLSIEGGRRVAALFPAAIFAPNPAPLLR